MDLWLLSTTIYISYLGHRNEESASWPTTFYHASVCIDADGSTHINHSAINNLIYELALLSVWWCSLRRNEFPKESLRSPNLLQRINIYIHGNYFSPFSSATKSLSSALCAALQMRLTDLATTTTFDRIRELFYRYTFYTWFAVYLLRIG